MSVSSSDTDDADFHFQIMLLLSYFAIDATIWSTSSSSDSSSFSSSSDVGDLGIDYATLTALLVHYLKFERVPRPFTEDYAAICIELLGQYRNLGHLAQQAANSRFKTLFHCTVEQFTRLAATVYGDDILQSRVHISGVNQQTSQKRRGRGRPRIHNLKRLMIFLYVIAKGQSLSAAHMVFNVALGNVGSIVKEVAKEVSSRLQETDAVRWPTSSEMASTMRAMQPTWDSYNLAFYDEDDPSTHEAGKSRSVVCLVDGTHIRFQKRPAHTSMTSLYCYKGYYSVLAMLFTDASSMRIWSVQVGHPGRTHDSTAARRSAVLQDPGAHHLAMDGTGFMILGDSAFPCTDYPFIICPSPGVQERSDPRCRVRSAVERVIGLAKGKFTILNDMIEAFNIAEVSLLAYTCFQLHNFFLDDLLEDTIDVEEALRIETDARPYVVAAYDAYQQRLGAGGL